MESIESTVNYFPPPPTTAEMVFCSGGGKGRTSVEQELPSGLEHLTGSLRAIKWTDEKHSLYLESMEASFVNQLHHSVDLFGWTSQKHVSNTSSSGQFKVFREGRSGKMNFRIGEAKLNEGDGTEVVQITSNPWTMRYRSECRKHTRSPASLGKDLHMKDEIRASSFYVRHRVKDSCSSNQLLEVTDQNFIDEDTKCEKECKSPNLKRIKTEAISDED